MAGIGDEDMKKNFTNCGCCTSLIAGSEYMNEQRNRREQSPFKAP